MGKSNLLDAIYFLSFSKSFSGAKDNQLILNNESFAMLCGQYIRRGINEEIQAGLRPGVKKTFRRGGKEYKRISEHIGAFPLVMLSPADNALVGEPAEHRRFLDQIISQQNPKYLDALQKYQKNIEQRNRLLKEECEETALFEALEFQLDATGIYIALHRKQCVEKLSELFKPIYREISGDNEQPELKYISAFADAVPGSFAEALAAKRDRDRILGYTGSGIQRDDIEMTLNGLSLRSTASQGQKKTFTSALRIAQYNILRESLGMNPLLLLDDIFDKLDADRVGRMMQLISQSDSFGQVFITDTNRQHFDEIVASLPSSANPSLWDVNNGFFSSLTSI